MINSKFQRQEAWNITLQSSPGFPERSTILCPPPIAVGTINSEHLASLICRGAESYHVFTGTLFSHILIPLTAVHYLREVAEKGGTGFYKSSWTLNGLSQNAACFSHLLASLSGWSNLQFLTLQPWKEVLSTVRLLRKHRAWCPSCLQEQRDAGKTVYELLIWSVEAVKICSHHKQYLTSQCPSCKSERQPVLDRKTWAGFCSRCGAWLGSWNSQRTVLKKDLSMFLWANECVGALIASAPSLECKPVRQNVMVGIIKLVDRFCDKNIAAFARSIGVPKHTAWMWHQGLALPRLEALIAICGRYSVDIVKLLSSGQIVEIADASRFKTEYKLAPRARKKRSSIDLDKAADKLKHLVVAKKQKTISMEEVALELNCSKRFLYKHFSSLCKQISQNYRAKLTSQHQLRIKRSRREVRDVVQFLNKNGAEPKYSQVRERLAKPTMLREKSIRSEWHKTKNELRSRKIER